MLEESLSEIKTQRFKLFGADILKLAFFKFKLKSQINLHSL